MDKESREKLPKIRTSIFTGDSKDELAEKIMQGLENNMIPVTDVIEVEFSKLGAEHPNGFMQIFSRLRDDS